jgi:uncharacterized protein YpuA (DUF1002 family)
MLDLLGQAITLGMLRVVLPLITIVVLTAVALRLVNMAAAEVDGRFIAPTEDYDRRARLHTLREAGKNTATVLVWAATMAASDRYEHGTCHSQDSA